MKSAPVDGAHRQRPHALAWARRMISLTGMAILACQPVADPVLVEPPILPPRHVSATIDGRSWTAANVEVEYDANAIRVTATIGQFQSLETLEFQFLRAGVGTQQLEGVTGGRYGRVALGIASLWQTGNGGGTGTLTVTTLTSRRVVGTFAFDAGPLLPIVSTELSRVTDGAFDITF